MTIRAVSHAAHIAASSAKSFRSRGHRARLMSVVAAMWRGISIRPPSGFKRGACRPMRSMIIRTKSLAMNGVHDMGGMDGFGPMLIEKDEPVFHADWEKRMYAIAISLARQFRNTDEFRHAIERIPAPIYLDSGYYERWLNAMMTLLVEKKKITREELLARGAAPVAPAQGRISFAAKRQTVKRAEGAFSRRRPRCRAQYQSHRPYAPAALCARKARRHSSRLGHLCFRRQQRASCG